MKTFILLTLILSSQLFAFEILFPQRLKSKLNEDFLRDTLIFSYNRVKIDAKIVYVPEEEINKRIESGQFDAIASKIEHESLLKHANKVEPPVIKDYEVSLWKLKSLPKKDKYKVGMIKGVVAYENATKLHADKFSEVKTYNRYYQLLDSLESGEIDTILLSKLAIEYNIPLSLKHNLEKIESNLYQTNLYHYIHKRHEDLERKISRQFGKLDRKKKLDLMDYYYNVFIAKKIKD